MRSARILIFFLLAASSLLAELSHDVRDYERVLIPIAMPVMKPGLTGDWRTKGVVSNFATSPVYVGQGDMHACQLAIPCPERGRMNPDSTIRLYIAPSLVLPIGSPQNPGAVFFVERPYEVQTVFSNRLVEERTGKVFDIPTVREREFSAVNHVRLLNVPMDVRPVTLRIYDPYDRENIAVDVVFSDAATRRVLSTVHLELRYEWEAPASWDFPMYPAYAVIGDIRSLFAPTTDAVQIDVTTTGGETGIWALASVTSATGDVLMVYPE